MERPYWGPALQGRRGPDTWLARSGRNRGPHDLGQENLTCFGLRANLTSFWSPKQVAAESTSGKKILCFKAKSYWPRVSSLCSRARVNLGRIDPLTWGEERGDQLSHQHHKHIFLRSLLYLPSPLSQPERQESCLSCLSSSPTTDRYPGPVDSAPVISITHLSLSSFQPFLLKSPSHRSTGHALCCSQNILFQA